MERPELSDTHFETMENTASSTDCTGLIPSAADSPEELESYEQVYHYLPPEPAVPFIPGLPNGIDPAPNVVLRDDPPVWIRDQEPKEH